MNKYCFIILLFVGLKIESSNLGRKAIGWAVQKNFSGLTTLLAQAFRVNINQQDFVGNTALHLAVLAGSKKTAQALLQLGANPNIQNNNNQSPLDIALLPNKNPSFLGIFGDSNMYQLNLESRDSNGMTPLQRSTAANARGEISAYFDKRLEQLMKLGANQNSLTADGRPLGHLIAANCSLSYHFHVNSFHSELPMYMPAEVAFLITGASKTDADADGNTLLHLAAKMNDHRFFVSGEDYLINQIISQKNNQGETPLLLAARSLKATFEKYNLNNRLPKSSFDRGFINELNYVVGYNGDCTERAWIKNSDQRKKQLIAYSVFKRLLLNGARLADCAEDPWALKLRTSIIKGSKREELFILSGKFRKYYHMPIETPGCPDHLIQVPTGYVVREFRN